MNIKGFICRQEMAQLPQGLFSLPSTGQDSYIEIEHINCQSNISMITDHQPNLSTIGVQNQTYQQLDITKGEFYTLQDLLSCRQIWFKGIS